MTGKITSDLAQFTAKPWWYTFRGYLMISAGGIIASLSMLAPNVYMMGRSASWIPIISIIVLLVGILRCIDALTSDTAQGYMFNMQGGILDIVVGTLVVFSNHEEPNYLNLLIVGYMLTQGIYRNIFLSVSEMSNPLVNRITGIISILLGLMIWIDWPAAMWFIAFSLSIDICFRGWVLIAIASSLKKQMADNK